jgi:PPOX class probable F420-dependent enzyme
MPAASATSLEERFPGKYVSLATFRRDGSAVATPVWFAIEGERLLIRTESQSWKVKRIRRNPAVTIAACSPTGALQGAPVPAHAEILPDAEAARIYRLITRRYRLESVFVLPFYRIVARLRGTSRGAADAALAITLDR